MCAFSVAFLAEEVVKVILTQKFTPFNGIFPKTLMYTVRNCMLILREIKSETVQLPGSGLFTPPRGIEN